MIIKLGSIYKLMIMLKRGVLYENLKIEQWSCQFYFRILFLEYFLLSFKFQVENFENF